MIDGNNNTALDLNVTATTDIPKGTVIAQWRPASYTIPQASSLFSRIAIPSVNVTTGDVDGYLLGYYNVSTNYLEIITAKALTNGTNIIGSMTHKNSVPA